MCITTAICTTVPSKLEMPAGGVAEIKLTCASLWSQDSEWTVRYPMIGEYPIFAVHIPSCTRRLTS